MWFGGVDTSATSPHWFGTNGDYPIIDLERMWADDESTMEIIKKAWMVNDEEPSGATIKAKLSCIHNWQKFVKEWHAMRMDGTLDKPWNAMKAYNTMADTWNAAVAAYWNDDGQCTFPNPEYAAWASANQDGGDDDAGPPKYVTHKMPAGPWLIYGRKRWDDIAVKEATRQMRLTADIYRQSTNNAANPRQQPQSIIQQQQQRRSSTNNNNNNQQQINNNGGQQESTANIIRQPSTINNNQNRRDTSDQKQGGLNPVQPATTNSELAASIQLIAKRLADIEQPQHTQHPYPYPPRPQYTQHPHITTDNGKRRRTGHISSSIFDSRYGPAPSTNNYHHHTYPPPYPPNNYHPSLSYHHPTNYNPVLTHHDPPNTFSAPTTRHQPITNLASNTPQHLLNPNLAPTTTRHLQNSNLASITRHLQNPNPAQTHQQSTSNTNSALTQQQQQQNSNQNAILTHHHNPPNTAPSHSHQSTNSNSHQQPNAGAGLSLPSLTQNQLADAVDSAANNLQLNSAQQQEVQFTPVALP